MAPSASSERHPARLGQNSTAGLITTTCPDLSDVVLVWLQMLRYNGDFELCFGAFHSLMLVSARDFNFLQTLQSVQILSTANQTGGDAKMFMLASVEVSRFRQLRKWLHEEDQCKECIQLAKSLQEWCKKPQARDLLRSLAMNKYVCDVLKMHLDTDIFRELQVECIHLVTQFVKEHTRNQLLLSTEIKNTFVPLLRKPYFCAAAADCVAAMTLDNENLSVNFSGLLVQVVGEVVLDDAWATQRPLRILKLLETLLVVDEHPVTLSQVQICKGAMVNRSLIETEGDLRSNEWGAGDLVDGVMPRMEVLACSLDETAPKSQREAAQQAVEYYNTSLVVMGICARGKMPTTELLCASVVPFHECIERLYELYELPQQDQAKSVMSKSGILGFFREVFVDTNSEHIIRSLKSPQNGLWNVQDIGNTEEQKEFPIAKYLLDELQWLCDKPVQAEARAYLFEQVVQFFRQFGMVIGPKQALEAEKCKIQSCYQEIGKILVRSNFRDASNAWKFSQRERLLLEQLESVVSAYAEDRDQAYMKLFEDPPKTETDVSEEAAKWQKFIEAAGNTLNVGRIRGTNRDVGIGVMAMANDVWQPVGDDGSDTTYAAYLVKPCLHRLAVVKKKEAVMESDVNRLLQVIDMIRAIPYRVATAVITGGSNENDAKEPAILAAFDMFINAAPVDCNEHPQLAAVQTEMIKQEWGLLCLNVLADAKLIPLHLAALRLLLALTGGGNADAQDELLKQVRRCLSHRPCRGLITCILTVYSLFLVNKTI